jgi:hypothetical protein
MIEVTKSNINIFRESQFDVNIGDYIRANNKALYDFKNAHLKIYKIDTATSKIYVEITSVKKNVIVDVKPEMTRTYKILKLWTNDVNNIPQSDYALMEYEIIDYIEMQTGLTNRIRMNIQGD